MPANHGGFETFAERYALFLAERGWRVSVYCQEDVETVSERVRTDVWRGITRIFIQTARKGGLGALDFDWKCVRDALKRPGVCLVLGYNGAAFLPVLEARRPQGVHQHGRHRVEAAEMAAAGAGMVLCQRMDRRLDLAAPRRRPSRHRRASGDAAGRARRRWSSPMAAIPSQTAPTEPLAALGLKPGRYLVSIARIEPDNNILTLVKAFSAARRGAKLVVLGKFEDGNAYHAKVRAAASDEVVFPGAIYDPAIVRALRFHARAYLHGHTVGGTNPSLVEALVGRQRRHRA